MAYVEFETEEVLRQIQTSDLILELASRGHMSGEDLMALLYDAYRYQPADFERIFSDKCHEIIGRVVA